MTVHPFAELDVTEGSLGIHWFEQNAYALKGATGSIMLVDPYFPHDRPAERFCRPVAPVVEADLPVDYVLVTHAHMDHTNTETLKRIYEAWPLVHIIGPVESVSQVLSEVGVPEAQTKVIHAGEKVVVHGYTICAVWGKPPEGDPHAGIKAPDVTHLSYVVDVDGVRVYITGDTINSLGEHDSLMGQIADMKPHIGLITTHPTEGEFPFFEGSIKIAVKTGLQTAVPAHYECFAKRTYDPQPWAEMATAAGVEALVIPWNSQVIYCPNE